MIQVELHALPPPTLRELVADALEDYWDDDAYEAALAREDEEREEL